MGWRLRPYRLWKQGKYLALGGTCMCMHGAHCARLTQAMAGPEPEKRVTFSVRFGWQQGSACVSWAC